MKPRWECVQCGANNSYWQTPCKKCGVTKLLHDKLIEANKAPVAEVDCSAGLALRDKLLQAALDIELQATRHRRASPLKRYLLTDLEIIGDKARELWKLIDQVS